MLWILFINIMDVNFQKTEPIQGIISLLLGTEIQKNEIAYFM